MKLNNNYKKRFKFDDKRFINDNQLKLFGQNEEIESIILTIFVVTFY